MMPLSLKLPRAISNIFCAHRRACLRIKCSIEMPRDELVTPMREWMIVCLRVYGSWKPLLRTGPKAISVLAGMPRREPYRWPSDRKVLMPYLNTHVKLSRPLELSWKYPAQWCISCWCFWAMQYPMQLCRWRSCRKWRNKVFVETLFIFFYWEELFLILILYIHIYFLAMKEQ